MPVDSFLLSKMAIDNDGFMLNYDLSTIDNKSFTKHIYEDRKIQDHYIVMIAQVNYMISLIQMMLKVELQ